MNENCLCQVFASGTASSLTLSPSYGLLILSVVLYVNVAFLRVPHMR
jgi:hypothetical protein